MILILLSFYNSYIYVINLCNIDKLDCCYGNINILGKMDGRIIICSY